VNQLYTLADSENIIVEYRKFPPKIQGAYCQEQGCPPVIGLSQSLHSNYRLHRCVMAEELGHHFTSSGECIAKRHHCTQDRLTIDKIEYKVLRWATNYLVPEDDLLDVIASGLCESWELAEHFAVTDEFMGFRMRLFGVKNSKQECAK